MELTERAKDVPKSDHYCDDEDRYLGKGVQKAVKNVDPELLPRILFYKGGIKTYKEALDFEKKDTPYFFVLDKDGKIIHATTGKYSEKKMEEVEAVLEE